MEEKTPSLSNEPEEALDAVDDIEEGKSAKERAEDAYDGGKDLYDKGRDLKDKGESLRDRLGLNKGDTGAPGEKEAKAGKALKAPGEEAAKQGGKQAGKGAAKEGAKQAGKQAAKEGTKRAAETGIEAAASSTGVGIIAAGAIEGVDQASKLAKKTTGLKPSQQCLGCTISLPFLFLAFLGIFTLIGSFFGGSGTAVADPSPSIAGLETPPGITGPDSNNYYQFPASSEGIYSLYGARDHSCNHTGSLILNQVTYTVAKKFHEEYPEHTFLVGDFNSQGHITHEDGRDVDIFITGAMVDYNPYNRAAAIYAAKLFFETDTIKWIYYDDPAANTIINAFVQEYSLNGAIKKIGGHGNHFHVRLLDEYAGPYHKPSCP